MGSDFLAAVFHDAFQCRSQISDGENRTVAQRALRFKARRQLRTDKLHEAAGFAFPDHQLALGCINVAPPQPERLVNAQPSEKQSDKRPPASVGLQLMYCSPPCRDIAWFQQARP